jgi:hypothetical protein
MVLASIECEVTQCIDVDKSPMIGGGAEPWEVPAFTRHVPLAK